LSPARGNRGKTMKPYNELKKRVEDIIWSFRFVSTSGVVPIYLVRELLEEIKDRDKQIEDLKSCQEQ
jgi:hypothetical protein